VISTNPNYVTITAIKAYRHLTGHKSNSPAHIVEGEVKEHFLARLLRHLTQHLELLDEIIHERNRIQLTDNFGNFDNVPLTVDVEDVAVALIRGVGTVADTMGG